ncbi:MAG: hypothetical protein AAF211_00145, partial [Myxococcota bacterium]
MRRWLPLLAAVACGSGEESPTTGGPEEVTAEAARTQAMRVSMAVRGHRPSLDELDAVSEDPTVLPSLLETWMASPAFGET